MSKETITLVPAGGSPLVLDGDILVVQANWGDHEVAVQLAQGPGIDGAIAGKRNRVTREIELQLVVDATSETFISTQAALELAVAQLSERGGAIVRQRTLESGEVLGPVEAEVLTAALSAPDDFLLQRTLRLTCQPLWLGQEKVIASLEGSADSIHVLELEGVKGNLPGPGRIAIRDREGEARRFVEIGQAWTHPAEQIEFDADEVDPGVGSLSGDVVELTPLVPSWQTVAELADLPHRGSFRVRVRASHDSEATVRQRVAYRIGDGTWRALDSVTLQAGDAWDLDLGAIHHHGDGTLSVRVQVHCDQVDATATHSFSRLTLMPTERYALARGSLVAEAANTIAGYDNFETHTPGGLNGLTAPLGGTWTTAGDTSPAWEVSSGGRAERRGAPDSGTLAGGHARLGAANVADVTVVGSAYIGTHGAQAVAWVGVTARYVNTNNYLAALVQYVPGHYQVVLAKVVGGSLTVLASARTKYGSQGNIGVSVTNDGEWQFLLGPPDESDLNNVQPIASGTDSDLASGGALASGGVGIYGMTLIEPNVRQMIDAIAYWTGAPVTTTVDVVRANGLGVFTDTTAYTADASHENPAPIADYRGHRVMVPPGDSHLAVKLRRTNLDTEPDTGPDDDKADITVYHRPAFVTLPGEVAQEEGIFV